MARLKLRIVAQDIKGNAQPGATVKLYEPGTASVAGTATTGTPFAGSLYAGISGGDPVSTTRTADDYGRVTLYIDQDDASRCDVGVEGTDVVGVFAYEEFLHDPADLALVATAATLAGTETLTNKTLGAQTLLPTSTLGAPGLAQVGDLDTGFGVDADGDPFVSKDGIGILETSGTTTSLRSPDGTEAISITDAGVATTPKVLERYGVYNVLDHGIVTGSTAANAAANTTALEALWVAVATAGGGTIHFPPGTYPLNATTLNHELSSTLSISLRGSLGAAVLKFYGETGPFLDVASGSTSALIRCGLRDLMIVHGEMPTSGATLRFGSVSQYEVESVRVMSVSATLAPLAAVQLGVTGLAINGISFLNCKFGTRADYATLSSGAITPSCIEVRNDTASAGLKILNCELDGAYDADATPDEGYSIGLRLLNTALWDTIVIGAGTIIKDHKAAIQKTGGAGDVANVMIGTGVILDVCEDANIQLEPPTGSDLTNWQIIGVWMSALKQNIIANEGGGGTITGLMQGLNILKSATVNSIGIGAGVRNKLLIGNLVEGAAITGGGDSAVEIGSASAGEGLVAVGNIVEVNASASASLKVGSGEDGAAIVGNVYRGDDISFGGSEDASRLHDSDAYLA